MGHSTDRDHCMTALQEMKLNLQHFTYVDFLVDLSNTSIDQLLLNDFSEILDHFLCLPEFGT